LELQPSELNEEDEKYIKTEAEKEKDSTKVPSTPGTGKSNLNPAVKNNSDYSQEIDNMVDALIKIKK